MRQFDLPLLRTIVHEHDIESVTPCSRHQRHALGAENGFGRQTIIFKIKLHDGKAVVIDRVKHAWQKVIHQHTSLRTIFAVQPRTKDIFKVVIKTHLAAFIHVYFRGTDDLKAKVEQEPLPNLTPELPMHVVHVYTNDGSSSPLLRLCFSPVSINDDSLVGIQADLSRAYRSLASPAPQPGVALTLQGTEGLPPHTLERIGNLEPTIFGHSVPASQVKSRTTVAEYINVAMPVSLGQALLSRCSDDGVDVMNMFQSVWLIISKIYLNLDRPCCRYTTTWSDTVTSIDGIGCFAQHDLLCTAQLSDDYRVTDVLRSLHAQTVEDEKVGAQASSITTYNGERLCNSTIRWLDCTAAPDGLDKYMSLIPIKASGFAKDDITFTLIYDGEELVGQLRTSYSVERWLAKSISDMFVQSLEFILRHPSCKIKDIPRCSRNDIRRVHGWNDGSLRKYESCVHDTIRNQARLHPGSPAIVAHDGYLSYQDLEALTNRLAHTFFTRYAFQPEEKVILVFPHSVWSIVAMIAVMKAGSAFVPLDENFPLDRVKSIASKSNARFVITNGLSSVKYKEIGLGPILLDQSFVSKETLSAMEDWANRNVSPSNLAYVIFTSGSTGEPKGCAIEHQAFCSSALAYGPELKLGSSSRILQFSSYAFDASLVDILVGLISGSCICVPSDHDRMNDLGQAAMRMEANWAMLTPSLVSRLNIENAKCIKTLVLVGEPLSANVRDAWVHRVDLFGGYGPSEVGPISAVVGPMTSQSHPTNIGYPVGNKSWVVDPTDHDQLVPVGAIGELVIESYSLGRGYIGDDARTNQVFIENPEWSKLPEFRTESKTRRMYKTGDLVTRCENGTLQYIGRKDMQVKVRGQRMELGDIETHLKTIVPFELAVELGVPRGCKEDEKMLIAFLCLGPESRVPDDLSSIDITIQAQLHALLDGIEEKLSSKVARYMLPVAYLPLRNLPVTISGKRDRRKLQQLITSLNKEELLAWRTPKSALTGGRPIVTDMDQRVANLWSKVLGVETENLNLDDDFVKRGGDSLAAMRLANLAKDAGLKLSFRDIYRNNRRLGDQAQVCIKHARIYKGKI
ncbi:acetyl-CoA synthetase-like protein [Annulohypoxylon maeteangense]|uniref:acetyl-CoA synthetase-like protein n=1 Tax=Annulohypoxylon maeteangense TaxID=1927788 RepID=UPI002007E66A|nr:acetyl-CoA synthetase-like protein [Annulohypoxylon maeteangense]KAI0883627.1 acetyl-CoA synthetase-like protein [Annulohypoxylon maeteangense]